MLVQSEPTLFLETPLYSVGSDCNSLRLYSLSYSLSPRCSNSLSPRCSYSRSPRLYSLSPLYIPSLDSSHTGSCTSIVSSHYYPLLASPTPAPTTSHDPRAGKYGADAYWIFCRGRWREVAPEDKDLRRCALGEVDGGEGGREQRAGAQRGARGGGRLPSLLPRRLC